MKKTIFAITAAASIALSFGASGETLRDALAAAYSGSPDLLAQRASLRAIDEGVPRAGSAFLPSLTGVGNITRQNVVSETAGIQLFDFTSTSKFYQARADQQLFRGFQDFHAYRQAKSLVKAGRAQLRTTEQRVLLDAVTAYTDTMRDISVLALNQNNVKVLERQLQASRDRFRLGEITRTDVAQSEARLAGAVSLRITAGATLAATQANYQRVIGNFPGSLEKPPQLEGLPLNIDEAWSIAVVESPTISLAEHNERAAQFAVRAAKGGIMPTVTGFATIARSTGSNPSVNTGTTVDFATDLKTFGVQIRVPLYQGGAEYSDIRRAKQTQSQRRLEMVGAERQVRSDTRTAFEQHRAAKSSIISNKTQVGANEIALEGVRQEAFVGSRTTLDVLDAEQELLDSRVNLARAERNEYVAGFALLSALGRLNAVSLDLPVD
ncbi:MAG: TolC family outer membrane protein, partial [Sphingomonadales bacterium]